MSEHDPIHQLETFSTGGLATAPLPASEVRRLGDRRRNRQRSIAINAAALGLIAAVVPAVLLVKDGDPKTSPPVAATPTHSRAASPSPSANVTEPPSEVITYPGNGLEIRDPADVTKLTGTSPEFQAFIADEVRRANEAGKQCPDAVHAVTVQKYSGAGYAYGSYNDCGGYLALWADKDAVWSEGYATQDGWDCDTLTYFGVPKDFIGEECIDVETEPFGPTTFGSLRLGMTEPQLVAAGASVEPPSPTPVPEPECRPFSYSGNHENPGRADGFVEGKHLVAMFAPPAVKTPEGIGLGSSRAKVLAAYPDADVSQEGWFSISQGDGTQLKIGIEQNDTVGSMSLERIDQQCFD